MCTAQTSQVGSAIASTIAITASVLVVLVVTKDAEEALGHVQ